MNTNNLRTFLQGDGIWILTAIAVLLALNIQYKCTIKTHKIF